MGIINETYLDSVGRTLVFSVDEVFSYSVVDRRGIIPLGPTVRFPFVGSYFDDERGFAGLVTAIGEKRNYLFIK